MALSWKDSSTTVKPRRGLRPRFAGAIKVRVEALARYRAFLHAYKRARIRWLDGLDALFPKGTYWLSRFAFIRVDETA
jgi:hypothetical protein